MNPHDLLLPAQAFHAFFQQRFAARQANGHLQKISVHQLHTALFRSLLDLLDPLRLEVHDGDNIIHLRKSKLVIGIVTDSIQVAQIVVGAIHPFLGEVGQPTATGGMEVGNNKGFLGGVFGRRQLPASIAERHAGRRASGKPSQELTPADQNR